MSEPWELSPEEIAKFEQDDCADYGGGVKFDFVTTDSEGLAHAASLKAREETLKEIGEWLYLAILHDHIERDKDKIFGAITALKAGRKP